MKKLKNYLKVGILLFGISLLLWNCEKDTTTIIENQSIETDNSPSQDDISIESFDFEKFKEFPIYSQLDSYIKFNSKSRVSKKKEHKFKIHKNTFKKITKEDIDYNSYTFLISDTENFDYAIVKNLVINQYKKNIEVFIFTYNNFDISDEHKYNINENVLIEQLFDFDISELGDLASRDGILIDGLGGDGTGDEPSGSGGGGGATCYNVSIIINYPCYGPNSAGYHYHDSECNCNDAPGGCSSPSSQYVSDTFCTSDTNSTSATSTYIYNNNLSGGGSGNPNVTITDNNIIISSIIENEVPEGADPLAFKLNLDSSSDAYNWVVNTDNSNEKKLIGFFLEENKFSIEAKNFAIEIIKALILNIPVIFDIEKDNIYQNKPLNFNSLTPEQKVAVVVYAIKKAVSNNAIAYFDIHKLFYNLPTVNVDVVAKIPIGGKLLDVRITFGVYNNLLINDFPNNGRQLGPLAGNVGNYNITGYWWTLYFKSYNPSNNYSADALWIQVKQKGQYDYENGIYFENYLGY